MKRTFLLVLVLVLGAGGVAASQSAMARAIDFNLNDDVAMFRYIAFDGRAGGFGKREMDIGLLYTTDNDYVGMFGAQVIAEAGSATPGLDAGIGFKIFGARSDRADIYALSIGGQLRYALPPHRRAVVGVEGYYAPRVVTFSDGDNFSYATAYIGYELLPQALIYLGYRDIRARLEQGLGTRKIENGGHFGVRFEF